MPNMSHNVLVDDGRCHLRGKSGGWLAYLRLNCESSNQRVPHTELADCKAWVPWNGLTWRVPRLLGRECLINAVGRASLDSRVVPVGLAHLKRIEAVVEDPVCNLLAVIIAVYRGLLAQIAEKTEWSEVKTRALKALAAQPSITEGERSNDRLA